MNGHLRVPQRIEASKLRTKELLEMALEQKENDCTLGGLCQYKILYKSSRVLYFETIGEGMRNGVSSEITCR